MLIINLCYLRFVAGEISAGTLLDLVMGDYKGPSVGTFRLVLKQVSKGLEYLHEKKIFHRELKPANVFISRADGTVRPIMKLGNFGIHVNKKEGALICNFAGSKSWLPPEIYTSMEFTAAMDLFALGLLLGFTLSRGRHPYGDDEEIRVSRIKKNEPITLSVHNLKNVKDAAEVFQLICSLLSADPTERPQVSTVLKHAFFIKPTAVGQTQKDQEANSDLESNYSRKRKNSFVEEMMTAKNSRQHSDVFATSSRYQSKSNAFSLILI